MSSTRYRMMGFIKLLVLGAIVVILTPGPTCARPPPMLSRHRRVSDQRLAEIETLLGLEKVRGKVVTVPVAFGVLDPDKIGRRRRSATDGRIRALRRIMQIVANNPDIFLDENENFLSFPVKSEDTRRVDDGYQLI